MWKQLSTVDEIIRVRLEVEVSMIDTSRCKIFSDVEGIRIRRAYCSSRPLFAGASTLGRH